MNFFGGGVGVVIFNPKIYVAEIGDFKQGLFEHEIDTKRVNSGSTVCFFNNCIEKIEEGMCMHFISIWPSYILAYMQPDPL